jgi:hypothetical protein
VVLKYFRNERISEEGDPAEYCGPRTNRKKQIFTKRAARREDKSMIGFPGGNLQRLVAAMQSNPIKEGP